jgi:hypothetical protein
VIGRRPQSGSSSQQLGGQIGKHLGLIVETSPIEIISKTKQGISLYDLATFTLAGVKDLASKQDELEQRVALLELKLNDTGTLADGTIDNNSPPPPLTVRGGIEGGVTDIFLASFKEVLQTLGAKIQDGVLTIKNLIADRVTTKELEIVDKATGEIYCTWIEGGEWVKVKSECKYFENNTEDDTTTVTTATTTDSNATTSPPSLEPVSTDTASTTSTSTTSISASSTDATL